MDKPSASRINLRTFLSSEKSGRRRSPARYELLLQAVPPVTAGELQIATKAMLRLVPMLVSATGPIEINDQAA
jgi:hypothetical protein